MKRKFEQWPKIVNNKNRFFDENAQQHEHYFSQMHLKKQQKNVTPTTDCSFSWIKIKQTYLGEFSSLFDVFKEMVFSKF